MPEVKVGDTQTGYVLALHMNLVPDSSAAGRGRQAGCENSKPIGWKLGTGFLGTPYLLAALVDTGHADVAYRLLLNTEYPSWGYLVDHGATTMWERWNGDQMRGDPSMNSYNHYAYGAVADWIYRYAAGVDALGTMRASTPSICIRTSTLAWAAFSSRMTRGTERYNRPGR